jgi:peroxiredoxin Q/BCP
MTSSDIIAPGKKAPNFNLPDQTGQPVQLSDFKGKTVVIYFYPKDDTPGCTKEACGFRDQFPAFKKSNAVILGVSPDSTASHLKFIKKHELPFSLLSDPEHTMLTAYGMWVEKSMYGRKYMGVERSTVIIGPDGIITHVFRKVKPDLHPDEVLQALGLK